jgi:hypothetical protein
MTTIAATRIINPKKTEIFFYLGENLVKKKSLILQKKKKKKFCAWFEIST